MLPLRSRIHGLTLQLKVARNAEFRRGSHRSRPAVEENHDDTNSSPSHELVLGLGKVSQKVTGMSRISFCLATVGRGLSSRTIH
uniref:Uncharacterized protein n=1 Tax=Hyaloperonospora arabidopsidis (strain Emoy2) TaxID=559515 RepID=M4B951_HYAAE